MTIKVGDTVKLKDPYSSGKFKVTEISLNIITVKSESGNFHYYFKDDLYFGDELEISTDTPTTAKSDLYCSCIYYDRKLVKSSIQVHRSVNNEEEFSYCKNCKKEYK